MLRAPVVTSLAVMLGLLLPARRSVGQTTTDSCAGYWTGMVTAASVSDSLRFEVSAEIALTPQTFVATFEVVAPNGAVQQYSQTGDIVGTHVMLRADSPYLSIMAQGEISADWREIAGGGVDPGHVPPAPWNGSVSCDASNLSGNAADADGNTVSWTLARVLVTSSTTSSSTSTTSTTLLPCSRDPRCALYTATQGPTCAGEAVPTSIVGKLEHAASLVQQASAAHGKRARGLRTKASRLLDAAARAVTRSARSRKPQLSRDCAAAIAAAAGIERDGLRSR